MLNMIQSERLKYKRTFAKKLVYIAPLFLCTIRHYYHAYDPFQI